MNPDVLKVQCRVPVDSGSNRDPICVLLITQVLDQNHTHFVFVPEHGAFFGYESWQGGRRVNDIETPRSSELKERRR